MPYYIDEHCDGATQQKRVGGWNLVCIYMGVVARR